MEPIPPLPYDLVPMDTMMPQPDRHTTDAPSLEGHAAGMLVPVTPPGVGTRPGASLTQPGGGAALLPAA